MRSIGFQEIVGVLTANPSHRPISAMLKSVADQRSNVSGKMVMLHHRAETPVPVQLNKSRKWSKVCSLIISIGISVVSKPRM